MLRIHWDLALQSSHPKLRVTILGTDAEPQMLARAKAACYPTGALKDLPEAGARRPSRAMARRSA